MKKKISVIDLTKRSRTLFFGELDENNNAKKSSVEIVDSDTYDGQTGGTKTNKKAIASESAVVSTQIGDPIYERSHKMAKN